MNNQIPTSKPPVPRATIILSYLLLLLLMASGFGCYSAKVTTFESKLGKQRATEKILLLPPICQDPRLDDTCESLSRYLRVEVPKRVNGQVVIAEEVDSLRKSLSWNNLIVNGTINTKEVTQMAKTLGCKSAVTCQIIEVKEYPPFRLVVNMLWIDTRTNYTISKLYNIVDLADSDTAYRYRCFVGEGPMSMLYQEVFTSEDRYHTACLSPEQFLHFVAAYSSKVIFDDKNSSFWTLWRTF